MKKRIAWIDTSKGIAILLVIVGHCLKRDLTCAFIFNFHMPLFFFLSSLTSTYSRNIEEFKTNTWKSFRHLIIPAIVMFLFRMLFDYAFNITDIKTTSDFTLGYITINNFKDYFLYQLRVLLYASGAEIWKNDVVIRPIGILWFLFVLFEAKTLFDFLQLKFNKKTCLILSALLCVLSIPFREIEYNFFSIDIALTVLPIMYVGYAAKENTLSDKKISYILIGLITYLILCYFSFQGDSYLELASREYPYFPFCFLLAFIGIFTINSLSKLIEETKLAKILMYFGRNSMILYCVHYFDYLLTRRYFYQNLSVIPSIVIRLAVDIAMVILVLKTKEFLTNQSSKKGCHNY